MAGCDDVQGAFPVESAPLLPWAVRRSFNREADEAMNETRRRIEEWTLGPVYSTLAGLLFFILAAAAVLFPGELRDATREFAQRLVAIDPGRPHVWTLAFWGMLAALAATLYLRLRTEAWEKVESTRRLLQAVHRSPNPKIFVDYPRLFREAEASAKALESAAGQPASVRREAALAAVHEVLNRIIEFARYFSQAPATHLRASIYLVAEPAPAGPPYHDALIERLRFFDRTRHRLEGLRSLLFLPGDLAVGHKVPRDPGEVLVALPVPQRAETTHGHRLALPGAPFALLSGEACIYEDTRESVGEWCADLEKSLRDEIERYFGKGGDGGDTRSFLSIRLGPESDPVGVLSLESDHTHVLGPEPEYHVTFFALAEPLVRLLIGPVSAYTAAARELELLPFRPPRSRAAHDERVEAVATTRAHVESAGEVTAEEVPAD